MVNLLKVRRTLSDFAKSTTAHGVAKLVEAPTSWPKRLSWLIVCSVAFVLLIMQLVLITQEYQLSPKITNTELVNQPIPFPSVSVCNLRAVDLYNLQISLRILTDQYFNTPNTTLKAFETWHSKNQSDNALPEWSMAGSNLKYHSVEQFMSRHLERLDSDLNGDMQSSILYSMLSPANFIQYMSKSRSDTISLESWKMIATCEFHHKKCTYKDFNTFFSPQFYNCFTFNVSRLLQSSQTRFTGPYGGLSVLLFVPSIQMFKTRGLKSLLLLKSVHDPILSANGVRVTVHSQDEEPDVISKGVDIPNGFSSSISLRVSKFNRYNTADSPCFLNPSVTGKPSPKYSQSTCLKECAQAMVIEKCDCVSSILPINISKPYPMCGAISDLPDECYSESHNGSVDEICKTVADEFLAHITCERRILGSVDEGTEILDCNCPPPCEEYVYLNQYGLSHWPTILDDEEFKCRLSSVRFFDRFEATEKHVCFSRLLNGSAEDVAEFLSEGHFIRLNVYLSDSTVLSVQEVPRYKFMQAVSDVGGQMGLWMGVSLITLAECLSLLLSLGKQQFSQLFPKLCVRKIPVE